MALIRFAEGQQRSGALGGSVYSHNRTGAYIRARTVPVNPRSTAQVAVRAAMLAAQARWQALTAGEQGAWESYASAVAWKNKLGDSVKLTGQQHFLRVGSLARYIGLASAWDAAPTQMRLPAPDETLVLENMAEGADAGSLGFASATEVWKSVADAFLLLFIGREVSPSRRFYGGPYRYAGKVEGATPTPPTTLSFTNPFGDFAGAGNNVYAYARTFIPGIGLSEPVYVEGVVEA